MSFGQPSGPPASARQVAELLRLLQAAGHTGFRDARGPMGFTQRQAGGKFTVDEASALIAQLQGDDAEPAPPASAPSMRRFTDEQLADELVRRGWVVIAPT